MSFASFHDNQHISRHSVFIYDFFELFVHLCTFMGVVLFGFCMVCAYYGILYSMPLSLRDMTMFKYVEGE